MLLQYNTHSVLLNFLTCRKIATSLIHCTVCRVTDATEMNQVFESKIFFLLTEFIIVLLHIFASFFFQSLDDKICCVDKSIDAVSQAIFSF